jgi:hypothetical protein
LMPLRDLRYHARNHGVDDESRHSEPHERVLNFALSASPAHLSF